MHGGFEKEAPNVPTNSIMKFDLLAVLANNEQLKTKLQSCIGSNNKKNKGGTAGDSASPSGSKSQPMQSLARNNMIRVDRSELEVNPGTGQTELDAAQQTNESLQNLFLSHLLRPREWSS